MQSEEDSRARDDSQDNQFDSQLYHECLRKAEGDETRAKAMYFHRISAEHEQVDLDQREKWPMLLPLLTLYTLGTIGVLILVFGFLGYRLDWW